MSFPERLKGIAPAVNRLMSAARQAVGDLLTPRGVADAKLAHQHQRALHGLAWMATTAQAIIQAAQWGLRLEEQSALGEAETLLLQIGVGEYVHQLAGGIPMGQNEIFRPVELGLIDALLNLQADPAVAWFLAHGNTPQARLGLIAQVRAA